MSDIAGDFFSRTSVVLLRPKSPGNVGSVARAMKNMGFSHLVVADPITYDDPDYFRTEAARMAWNASDLLARLERASSLEEALAPAGFVLGTTSHPPEGTHVLDPPGAAREMVRLLQSGPQARVALLFGQEDIGLTRYHLARCHALGAIPSALEYPSLNLSQAALIFLYELRGAILAADPAGPGGPHRPADDPPPSQARLDALYARLEPALEEIGFLQGSSRQHMMRDLRRLFNRALLTERDVALLDGIARQMRWAARRGRPSGSD
jgi:TrmH family RNA methyltransferase